MPKADIGLIGLAVMGENLILNMESKGFTVACYNRTVSKVDDFLNSTAKGKNIIGCKSVAEFAESLKTPRKIMLMVKAGVAVDDLIAQILPHLDNGDIIIDGGNTHFSDTIRRTKYIEALGKLYIGTGISGGEQGARLGPSIMPGGSPAAWPHIKPIFENIAARTPDGEPCCRWVGDNGAGHFIKMVHNGIEYGDMQMICEAYHLMKTIAMTNSQMHDVFDRWNAGELNSYLIEITADILSRQDPQGSQTIDLILDAAGQKGTGQWIVSTALELGQPLTLTGEAVFARFLSSLKDQRVTASKILSTPSEKFTAHKAQTLNDLCSALYASRLINYAQSYQLMHAASAEYKWNLDYSGIALMWQGGCIIRSSVLGKIKEAFAENPSLANLLLSPFFSNAVIKAQTGWRRAVTTAVNLGVPMPAIGSALAYFDGFRTERLPANLLQAQRDYFGSHSYQRLDKPRGEFFHTNWTDITDAK